MSATIEKQELTIGSDAPDFTLPGIDGINYSLHTLIDSKQAVVVIFSCNHCPYVQAYEERLIALQHEFVAQNVALVCVNSNDDTNYPQDSYSEMIIRAQREEFNFLYLRDHTQQVARTFGAKYTPEAYLFDHEGILRYNGRIDDNWQDPALVKDQTLREAIRAVLSGQTVASPVTHAIGCTIKWKPA
ncbi:MAG: thioredoxin family protein [Verrucomicrobia bacterium Tous-C9LFEB]|nr:MAG: thioredoxin family protein [Verrucomicrobia bacterium Tous-C9LFEB]